MPCTVMSVLWGAEGETCEDQSSFSGVCSFGHVSFWLSQLKIIMFWRFNVINTQIDTLLDREVRHYACMYVYKVNSNS